MAGAGEDDRYRPLDGPHSKLLTFAQMASEFLSLLEVGGSPRRLLVGVWCPGTKRSRLRLPAKVEDGEALSSVLFWDFGSKDLEAVFW